MNEWMVNEIIRMIFWLESACDLQITCLKWNISCLPFPINSIFLSNLLARNYPFISLVEHFSSCFIQYLVNVYCYKALGFTITIISPFVIDAVCFVFPANHIYWSTTTSYAGNFQCEPRHRHTKSKVYCTPWASCWTCSPSTHLVRHGKPCNGSSRGGT